MKKIFLILILAMMCHVYSSAQSVTDGPINFLKGITCDVSFGFGGSFSKEPYSVAKVSYSLGIDARKKFKTFADGKADYYGLVGLQFQTRGGKKGNDFMGIIGDDEYYFNYNELCIPIHAGVGRQIKACRLFIDAGPYIGFRLGGSNYESLKTKPFDFGVGFNFGIKIVKVILAYKTNIGLLNVGQFVAGDKKYNLPTTCGTFTIGWSFGAKDKL
ncbi:MAG: outer membrane beta-barrel protein [Paramuribaculum sp.]|nr:outer membrane beta-barrel protein [Paramuribaculum sp.]